MTRISLKEQYDNSSVVKQIVDLSDKVDETAETAETAKTMASEAGVKADVAKATADTATAKSTEQDAAIAALQTKDTEQDAAIAAVKTMADAAVADVTINTDEISATLLLKNSVESETSKAIPLASENATGMMTKATYSGMVALGDRVTALEGKTTIVYVSFTSDDPSQSEITNLFTAQTGKTPIAGNQAVDIERSLTYQYNGSEWLKTTQQVAEWTNTTPGLVKGTPAGTENAGTIFAESDGTGSVNGWDDLVARVATNESAISTTIPNTYATKAALGEVESTANDAQTKVNGCFNAVALNETNDGLIFTTPGDDHAEVSIGKVSQQVISYSKLHFSIRPNISSYVSTISSSKQQKSYVTPTILNTPFLDSNGILKFWFTVPVLSFYAEDITLYYVDLPTVLIDSFIHDKIAALELPDGQYVFWFYPSTSVSANLYYGSKFTLAYEVTDGDLTLTETGSTKRVWTESVLSASSTLVSFYFGCLRINYN